MQRCLFLPINFKSHYYEYSAIYNSITVVSFHTLINGDVTVNIYCVSDLIPSSLNSIMSIYFRTLSVLFGPLY